MIILLFADLAYTLAAGGRPTQFMVPIIFAGLIGFLFNLAIAACHEIIMETYDIPDLQPGMTERPRRILPEEIRKKRTNFSCFPRVTAGFAIALIFAFIIDAGVTVWGGVVERHVGAQMATAVMAGVLLILTLMLMGVLWRFKTVQIIPSERFGTNILSGPEDEWKPVIIGNPSGTTLRMSILELGTLSRWSEIRRRKKLAQKAESTGFFLLYSLLTGDSPQLACAAVPYTYLHSKTINAIRQGFGAVLPWYSPYQLYRSRNRQATRLFTDIGDLSLLIDLRSDISLIIVFTDP